MFEKDTASTILTCILHGHIHNIAHPGTYNKEVNKLFKINKLPPIILPENSPSKKFFSLATRNEKGEETEEIEVNTETENEDKD